MASDSDNELEDTIIPNNPYVIRNDLVPRISLSDTLESYISEYPEDAPKWLKFLDDSKDVIKRRKPDRIDILTITQIDELIKELNYPLDNIQEDEINPQDGCVLCKKNWNEAPQAITELLCGHKFHTLCFCLNIDEYDTTACRYCADNSMHYVLRRIERIKRNERTRESDILMDALVERDDFKADLKEFKKKIANAGKSYSNYDKELHRSRRGVIRKHIHSLNHIQRDINQAAKDIVKSEAGLAIKAALRVYRKKSGEIFRKYHVSFRDLRERKLIKTSWRMRWVLEHHRLSNRNYRFGIRIYPGTKIWRDTPEEV